MKSCELGRFDCLGWALWPDSPIAADANTCIKGGRAGPAVLSRDWQNGSERNRLHPGRSDYVTRTVGAPTNRIGSTFRLSGLDTVYA